MDKVFRLIYGNFNHVYRALGQKLTMTDFSQILEI